MIKVAARSEQCGTARNNQRCGFKRLGNLKLSAFLLSLSDDCNLSYFNYLFSFSHLLAAFSKSHIVYFSVLSLLYLPFVVVPVAQSV